MRRKANDDSKRSNKLFSCVVKLKFLISKKPILQQNNHFNKIESNQKPSFTNKIIFKTAKLFTYSSLLI